MEKNAKLFQLSFYYLFCGDCLESMYENPICQLCIAIEFCGTTIPLTKISVTWSIAEPFNHGDLLLLIIVCDNIAEKIMNIKPLKNMN